MKNNKETPQGQIFGMARGTRLPPLREEEKAPPPTTEQIADAHAGKSLGKTENAVLAFAKRHPLVTAGSAITAVATGFAAVEAYQGNIPGIHESLPKGSSFDNGVGKGTISETQTITITQNMIKRVPEEEIQKLDSFARLANQKTTIITLRQPISQAERDKYNVPEIQFEVGEDKNTIEILYPFDFSQSSNPNAADADIQYVKSYVAVGGQADYDAFHDKGYSNEIEFRMKDGSPIPAGTIIQTPVVNKGGGYLAMSTMGDGLIDVQAPNGNIYRFLITGLKGRDTKIVPFKPLVPTPEFTSEFNTTPVGTYGYNVIGAKPILKTTEDVDRISISLLVATKGKIGEISRSRPGLSPFVTTNFEMFTFDGKILSRNMNND